MEDFPATFGCRHHRRIDNFCQDGNLHFSGLPPGFSFHPRWENFLVDGIHLLCLTIGAKKCLLTMETSWKRSFLSVHRTWYKLPGDGKMCQNKFFHSIRVEISFQAMEESACTCFSHTSEFDRSRWLQEASPKQATLHHWIQQNPRTIKTSAVQAQVLNLHAYAALIFFFLFYLLMQSNWKVVSIWLHISLNP